MFNHKKLPIMVLNYCILDTKSVIQNSSVLKKKDKDPKIDAVSHCECFGIFPEQPYGPGAQDDQEKHKLDSKQILKS